MTFFGAERNPNLDPSPAEIYPLGLAPFIRLPESGSGNRVVENAVFGMLAPFATEIAYGRKTYNARSETVDKLVTFKQAWAKGQRCIIPAEAIFEPCWETGSRTRNAWSSFSTQPSTTTGCRARWRRRGNTSGSGMATSTRWRTPRRLACRSRRHRSQRDLNLTMAGCSDVG